MLEEKSGYIDMTKHLKVVISGEIETRLSCEQKRLGLPMTGVVITLLNEHLPSIESYTEWGIFDPAVDQRIAPEKEPSESRKKSKKSRSKFPRFHQPTVDQVFGYLCQRGLPEEEAKALAEKFVEDYESTGWRNKKGDRVAFWTMSANTYYRNHLKWSKEDGQKKSNKTYF